MWKVEEVSILQIQMEKNLPDSPEVEQPETLFGSGPEIQHLQMPPLRFIKMGMPISEGSGWRVEDYFRITAIQVNRLLNFSFIHQEVMRFWDFHLPVNGPALV